MIPVRVSEGDRRIQAKDLAFVKNGMTTRDELVAKLGKPNEYDEDLRVAVYFWHIEKVWIILPGIPPGPRFARLFPLDERLDILLVQFHERDTVRRFKLMKHPSELETKEVIEKWLRDAR